MFRTRLFLLVSFFFIAPLVFTFTTPVVSSLLPLSERQCFNGFVCQHGSCRANKSGCNCDPKWSGTYCNLPCLQNCGENGECNLYDNGTTYCVCLFGFTGPNCTEKDVQNQTIECPTCINGSTSHPTPITVRPLTERTCFLGFVCQHGYCPKNEIRCLCDQGWAGAFCRQPCRLTCGEHGRCIVLNDDPTCSCEWGYTGNRCQTRKETLRKLQAVPESTTLIPSNSTAHHLTWNTSLMATSLRPLPERECLPGFVCQHGTCRQSETSTGLKGKTLECVCDKGWKGIFCHEKCPLDCGDNGKCDIFKDNNTLYCSCNWRYTGSGCSQLRPTPSPEESTGPSWHWWVVGTCAIVLLVLVSLLIVLPYWMWKRRDIFIMKIVYLFQPFEDDDDKLFDAFVSYKATEIDEHFVVHTLYPKLEKIMNFKLCLHFRDFMPGETIANNIIKAVENSRRTILILTPSYIQSEFCRFEYQRAQHEMLKRKQRIIPIVLRDISSARMLMDETLKTIMETITYIEWPTEDNDKKLEKFWKRLELSMPKRRQTSSTLVSTKSQSSCDKMSSPGVCHLSKGDNFDASSIQLVMLSETPSVACTEYDDTLKNSAKLEFADTFNISEAQHSLRSV